MRAEIALTHRQRQPTPIVAEGSNGCPVPANADAEPKRAFFSTGRDVGSFGCAACGGCGKLVEYGEPLVRPVYLRPALPSVSTRRPCARAHGRFCVVWLPGRPRRRKGLQWPIS